ncbi:MAG: hypothetical protein JKP90_00430 [Desulfofustis sp. PB-SRB1]|nr:hypothetical protein [Desulfofustis sp. PB-SRB1]
MKTYRDLLTTVFVLLPQIKRLKDERIGIMLPASVASVIAWLSVMYSGKTPVMINWTWGRGICAIACGRRRSRRLSVLLNWWDGLAATVSMRIAWRLTGFCLIGGRRP